MFVLLITILMIDKQEIVLFQKHLKAEKKSTKKLYQLNKLLFKKKT
jgi:hypothetical protein